MDEEHENINKKVNDWPIEPTFLSLRYGITDTYSASPNNDGLFYANELRGILADASAALWEKKTDENNEEDEDENDIGEGQIFALFQVVPDTFKIPAENKKKSWFADFNDTDNSICRNILKKYNKKIIRIHPGNLYPNLECCEQFRKCKYKYDDNGIEKEKRCKHKCFEMDSRITLLYDDKLRTIPKYENGENNWDEFYNELEKIIKAINKEIENNNNYKKDVDNIKLYLLESDRHSHKYNEKNENRPYMGYRCIYSGLMEYFFPIIHAGKIVAVLMHGQCALPGLKREEMFKNNKSDILEQWLIRKEESDEKETDVKKKLFHLPPNHLPISEQQLNIISDLIRKLEMRIEYLVKARFQRYVSDNFFERERRFRRTVSWGKGNLSSSGDKLEDLRKEIADLDETLQKYRRVLNRTLKEIIKQFNLDGFIRIYAIESPIANQVNTNKDVFNIIGDSSFDRNNPDTTFCSKYSKIIFNKIKERYRTLDKEELLKERDQAEPYFPERYWEKVKGFDPHVNDIFRVEFSFSSQIAYLIWERYDNLDRKSEQYKEYENYLKLMYHTLLEPYIIFERMKLEKDLEATMRISSHESAQIIPDVIDTINNQESLEFLEKEIGTYSGPPEITNSAKEIIDVSRRLSLLNELFSRLSRIFKEGKPELEYSDFHRIVYALDSLVQGKAYSNSRQRIMIRNDEDLKRYSLKTDYGELSHILFNLKDNAIKYGLRGSNIWINSHLHYGDVKIVDNHRIVQLFKKITISVVSYGDKIEDEDREKIFELYFRSKNAKGTQGMGIGLFLVQKLCNLLGYEIECLPSELIETYNLPLKYHYCKQNSEFARDTSLSSEISKILIKRIESEDYKVINTEISSEDWEITVADIERGKSNSKLRQHTYKNEFKITIPIKEGDLKRNKLY